MKMSRANGDTAADHAARDRPIRHRALAVNRRPQQIEFLTKLGQEAVEATRCCSVGGAHCRIVAKGLHDQIDRPVLQKEPLPVRQKPRGGLLEHRAYPCERGARPGANGHGLSCRCGRLRRAPPVKFDSGWTESM